MSKIKHNIVIQKNETDRETNSNVASNEHSLPSASSEKKQDSIFGVAILLWGGPLIVLTLFGILKGCNVI